MVKRKRICIIGAFADGQIAYGGQTTKVRNYSAELQAKYPDFDVIEIDTVCKRTKEKIKNLIKTVSSCLKSNIILILPGDNGLRVLLPITTAIKKMNHALLLYPVVGGWLPEYVMKNQRIATQLRSVDKVYVETKQMLRALNAQGFTNIEWAPVFTRRKVPDILPWMGLTEPLKLCTFSRITQAKGTGLAIQAVNILNKKSNRGKYHLISYGEIDPTYEKEYLQTVNDALFNAVEYGGKIDDDKVIETLAKQSILVFPTSHPGEGFPATVLEGMLAGLPVVASDWRYNNEIVENGYNGFLFDLKDGPEGLAEKIEALSTNELKLTSMHEHSLEKSNSFTPDRVLNSMYALIDNHLKGECR